MMGNETDIDTPTEATDPDRRVATDTTPDEAEAQRWVPLGQRISGRIMGAVDRARSEPGRAAEAAFSTVVLVLCTWLLLDLVHIGLVLRDTTPTGGDMGAHVWGPDYLRHHLLPKFRLSGWTADWYNGFPAYQFYMVIPSLLIVLLNVGIQAVVGAIASVVLLAGAIFTWADRRLFRFRRAATAAAVILTILLLPIPYNISFKLVTVAGILTMPLASWAMAKLADLPFPIPPFAAVASLIFLVNREPLFAGHGNIIGGNFTSTMAGEFAFSISLTLSILYLGVAAKGLRTGRYRALAAVLFALAGLCHLIPAFFVLACTAALFLLHPDRARLKWLGTMVPVAGLLTAFWVVPFWWRSEYVNDMGWERLPEPNARFSSYATDIVGNPSSAAYYLWPPSGMRWIMVAAIVGAIVSIIRRYRVGLVLSLAWAGVVVAFVVMPQYRLWNARLLPFMFLTVTMLAAIGIGELVRLAGTVASGRIERPLRPITISASAFIAGVTLISVILPLDGVLNKPGTNFGFERVPVQQAVLDADGNPSTRTVTETRFKLFGQVIHSARPTINALTGWSHHNYTGMEAKAGTCTTDHDGSETCTGGWAEFERLVSAMAHIGEDPDHGCGRTMWEYDKEVVGSYGTPMALMLLPYFTDGCIGSQEGLYFEATPSVPHHFIVQSELSASGSGAQSGIRYPGFDIDRGVRHLQMLGVRYYTAVSETAVAAADAHPDLRIIGTAGRWSIYQVADSPQVEALAYEPVVIDGIGEGQDDWLPTATSWFMNGDLEVPFAAHGPEGWERIHMDPIPTDMRRLTLWLNDQIGRHGSNDPVPDLPRRRLPTNEVTGIVSGDDRISFDVSRPGVPVLVKTSYFPNWQVSGGHGPYRVSPNLMVVVPTAEHVEMHFGRTPPDWIAGFMTLLGLVALVVLARSRPVEVSTLGNGRLSDAIDRLIALDPVDPNAAETDPAEAVGPDEASASTPNPTEPDVVASDPAGDPETDLP